jgi:hypothetical protein
MRRGTFLLTAFALAVTAVPARAAAPSTIVYEVRRLRSDANHSAEVVVDSTGDVPAMLAVLRPAKGGGYEWQELTTWPAGIVSQRVKISQGERVLVAGERGHLSVRVRNDRRWGVSTTSLAYRVVPEPAGQAARVEPAKVAGGRYGSLLVANPPCGVGTWSLHLDGEQGSTKVCGLASAEGVYETTTGKGWTMDATIVAPSSGWFTFRLLELPRRV